MEQVLHAAPPVGIAILSLTIMGVMVLLSREGAKEGKIAYDSGRYIIAYLKDDKIIGNLLATPPKRVDTLEVTGITPDEHALPADSKMEIDENGIKLREAPNMAIAEKSGDMLLPVISPDGVKPWEYYGRPFAKKGNMASISVIVTGLGINREMSMAASKLPPEICLSVSPYASDVPVWMASMRVLGHEFLLDMPLEPSNFPIADPGPKALMTRIMPEENMQNLKTILGATTGYVGLTVPADEVFFSGQKDFIEPVVKELADRGVMMVFAKPQERPALAGHMKTAGTVNLGADIHVRYGSDANDIKQQLNAVEAVALKHGSGLIIIQASPIALQVLQNWAQNLGSRGFQLTPVSALARGRFS